MGKLLAAAAKRLITPSREILDASMKQGMFGFFNDTYEDTYTRVLALADEDGHKAVLLAADIMSIPGQASLTQRVADRFDMDPLAVLYTCTHDHQTINIPLPNEAPKELLPTRPYQQEYLNFLHEQIMDALNEAFSSLREARMGMGSCLSFLNSNRDWPGFTGHIAGSNLQAFSNKELVVLKVDTVKGDPIAVFTNFDMHATFLFGMQSQEGFLKNGGDIPGAISRYVERAIGGDCVVGWTFGAAGDQGPFVESMNTWPVMGEDGKFTTKSQGLSIEGSMLLLEHFASVQGQEILRVCRDIYDYTSSFDLFCTETFRTVDGRVSFRDMKPKPAMKIDKPDLVKSDLYFAAVSAITGEGGRTEPEPSDKITYRMHLVVLNGVGFIGMNCEAYSSLGKMAKDLIPCKKTMFFSFDGGHIGYIPSVELANYKGFGNMASYARDPWDTKKAFIDGFSELAKQYTDHMRCKS